MKNITTLLRNFAVLYLLLQVFVCSRIVTEGRKKAQILFLMLIQCTDTANISEVSHKEYSNSCNQSHEALAPNLFPMIKRYYRMHCKSFS